MKQIYDYLYKNIDTEQEKLRQTISTRFKVDIFEANKIYDAWKQEYMKPKYRANGRAMLRF